MPDGVHRHEVAVDGEVQRQLRPREAHLTYWLAFDPSPLLSGRRQLRKALERLGELGLEQFGSCGPVCSQLAAAAA